MFYSLPSLIITSSRNSCAIVAGLSSLNPEKIEQDWTTFIQSKDTRILRAVKAKGKTIDYVVVGDVIYTSEDLLGRATLCHRAEKKTNPGVIYVVKDTWASYIEGQENKGSLLVRAKSWGIERGIPVVHHFEELSIKSNDVVHPHSMLSNRKLSQVDNIVDDKRRTRKIMSPVGTPLTTFSSRLELLLAYRDAALQGSWNK
ncbi:hypothetical protein M422DRAFT_261137 [Sphaerobolus stellatus SS14]|uniref:Fungal-type protein kinase domain-containing protein n=1 Tax=Sphaerobolus stellatus (strain SS14) TaxID=990650 RepID=A0A0C9U0Y5_SPHS4|nr:hypothetical protein M422DRAFT_261137 [Sphaerobolus stellatus SS14]